MLACRDNVVFGTSSEQLAWLHVLPFIPLLPPSLSPSLFCFRCSVGPLSLPSYMYLSLSLPPPALTSTVPSRCTSVELRSVQMHHTRPVMNPFGKIVEQASDGIGKDIREAVKTACRAAPCIEPE